MHGKTALHGTAGFAADGVTADANDQIDILAGFSRDLAGNVGADDAAALNFNEGPVYRFNWSDCSDVCSCSCGPD